MAYSTVEEQTNGLNELMLQLDCEIVDKLVNNFNKHSELLIRDVKGNCGLINYLAKENDELTLQIANLSLAANSRSTVNQYQLGWSLKNRILVNLTKNRLFIKESSSSLITKQSKNDLIGENYLLVGLLKDLEINRPFNQCNFFSYLTNFILLINFNFFNLDNLASSNLNQIIETNDGSYAAIISLPIDEFTRFFNVKNKIQKCFKCGSNNWILECSSIMQNLFCTNDKKLKVCLRSEDERLLCMMNAKLRFINQTTGKNDIFERSELVFDEKNRCLDLTIFDYFYDDLVKNGFVKKNSLMMKISLKIVDLL